MPGISLSSRESRRHTKQGRQDAHNRSTSLPLYSGPSSCLSLSVVKREHSQSYSSSWRTKKPTLPSTRIRSTMHGQRILDTYRWLYPQTVQGSPSRVDLSSLARSCRGAWEILSHSSIALRCTHWHTAVLGSQLARCSIAS